MKVKDSSGYATVIANVEQFGEESVTVANGSRVIFEGNASDFIAKHGDKYKYTLCADVRIEDGKNVVLF